jgi:hypothetical protein
VPFPEPCRCTGARGTGSPRARPAVSEHENTECMNLATRVRAPGRIWGTVVPFFGFRMRPYGYSGAARVPRTSGPLLPYRGNMTNSETELRLWDQNTRPVRSTYGTPVNGTFLSEQTSNQQSVSSTFFSEQISTSHQPPAKRTSCILGWRMGIQIMEGSSETGILCAVGTGGGGKSC